MANTDDAAGDDADRRGASGRRSGIERRLTLRILRLWWSANPGDEIPSLEDISGQEMDADGPTIVLLAIPDDGGEPIYERIGENFTASQGGGLIGKPFTEAPPDSALRQTIDYYDEVLEKNAPVTLGNEIIDENGDTLMYRSIILPLSDNKEDVNYLLCAASWKKKEDD